MPAYRLVTVLADAAGHERHLDSPMVGRAKELEMLERALERAVTERTSHLFTLLGSAGVGKSRLVAEFLSATGRLGDRPPRPMPLLRRGHHVLPARRGDPSGGGHPRRRGARRRASEARRPSWPRTPMVTASPGSWVACSDGARRVRPEDAFWAVRKAPRAPRSRTARGRGLRRHPLGGADVARPDRAPRRLDSRRRRPRRVSRQARAPRHPHGVGRRQDERHARSCSSPFRATMPHCSSTTSSGGRTSRRPRASGSSKRPRATRCSSRRCSRC